MAIGLNFAYIGFNWCQPGKDEAAMGKIFAIAGFLMISCFAQAKSAAHLSQDAYRGSSQEQVDAMNIVFPDLELSVIQPASDEVALDEIEALKAVIAGQPIGGGSLIHLACCHPRCGGGPDCK